MLGWIDNARFGKPSGGIQCTVASHFVDVLRCNVKRERVSTLALVYRLKAHTRCCKRAMMRKGVAKLAPRIVALMRLESGLLGRSMATVRLPCKVFALHSKSLSPTKQGS